MRRIAATSGHPIRSTPGVPGAGTGGTRVIVAALALAALATAGALVVVGRRRRKAGRSARKRGTKLYA
ncbi:MAG: hypothetical protein ACR2OB_13630 [Solirubrobacteraceae bacterium]